MYSAFMLNMYAIKHFVPLSFRISNCLTDVDNPIGVVEGFFFFLNSENIRFGAGLSESSATVE